MKRTILAVAVTMLCGLAAQAGGPGVITVNGSVNRQTNPQGRCGASTFGYVIYGSYTDSKGVAQEGSSCLDGIAVPLGAPPEGGDSSSNLMKGATKLLRASSGINSTLLIAVEDVDQGIDGGTLISIKPINETLVPAAAAINSSKKLVEANK